MLSNNFAMMVRVRGDVSAEQMQTALSQIHLRHAALAPAGADTVFPLVVLPQSSEDDWVEVVKAELGQSFSDAPESFARFHLLKYADGFDLVGCFDHGACDGMSGMFVLRDVLLVLGNPHLTLSPLSPPQPTGMLIPREVLTAPRFRFKLEMLMMLLRGRLLFEKIRRRLFPQKQAAQGQMTSSGGDSPLSSQFVILPVRLTASQTAALVARCKDEQVSVHAAICVAWLRAFLAEIKQGQSQGGMVSSPVNMRNHFSPAVDDTSGQFLTIVETTVDCPPENNFWDIAREFKHKFSLDTRLEELFFKPAVFMKIFTGFSNDDINMLMEIIFSGPVKYDFSITNLGRVAIPERSGSLQVEAFYGPLVNSSPYERTVGVSTLGGQMSMSFLFRKSIMDVGTGQKLMNRALGMLIEASNLPQQKS